MKKILMMVLLLFVGISQAQERWLPSTIAADGSFPEVTRHINRVIGKRYHQHCSNGGGDEPDHDGLRRCEDTFTNRKNGMPCKVDPDNQNQFVCKQKESNGR